MCPLPRHRRAPPPQTELEADYGEELGRRYDIVFNRLFTLANMPIQRFGSMLLSLGQFDEYMDLLRASHQDDNLSAVMCRTLLSVDWQGYVYDCDFNQMLGLPLRLTGRHAGGTTSGHAGGAVSAKRRVHLSDLNGAELDGNPIVVAGHCYGCTAGQGSSCGGALS